MDRGNVLSGAAFKGALVSALIFLGVIVVAGVLAYGYVHRTMLGVLEAQITQELVLFQSILEDGGPHELREALAHLDRPGVATARAAGLFGPSGARLAGNIAAAPDFVGWSRATLTIGQGGGGAAGHAAPFYTAALQLHGTRLVVGRSLDLADAAERTLIRALSLAGVFVIAAILLTGYAISRESLKKLQGIETALDRISQGDLAARLQVSPANDQIDRISRAVNAHLDRLARLMITTRATAAAIAHDLKTPLARAFLGLEQATAELDHGKDPRASIDGSLAELASLNAIFETVLRIVRVEAGADAGRGAAVDLGAMALDLAETFAPVAEDKGQTLTAALDGPGPFKAPGDERMVQQMIVNLLQNAVVHCPPGARIAIGVSRSGGEIRLTVTDTGPGIPASERAHAFEPFFRGKAGGAGSGLGLALVKAIADRHHAAVTLSDNAPGLRATVAFRAADAP